MQYIAHHTPSHAGQIIVLIIGLVLISAVLVFKKWGAK